MENEGIKKRVLSLWEEDQKRHEVEDQGHLPYLNLGRLYASKGMLIHAVKELEQALILSPGEPSCIAALQHIQSIMN